MKKILLTGGLGYIGSHIASLIEKNGIILDNSSNSNLNIRDFFPNLVVIKNDINPRNLNSVFEKFDISGVIHLAGYKSVNESVLDPLKYYKNNLNTTIDILDAMKKHQIKNLIFSSSATVYGDSNLSPINEKSLINALNPYGNTKIMNEKIIDDFCNANKKFKAISLRYFNPIGAHRSGKLCDRPIGEPLNIMPRIIESIKMNKVMPIYGNDYDTIDGTGVRDYIHVMDLAYAHLLSLKKIRKIKSHEIINIGTGKGTSVLELIKTFEKVNKIKLKTKFMPRRHGDSSIVFADVSKSEKILNWKPKYGVEEMCKDSFNSVL